MNPVLTMVDTTIWQEIHIQDPASIVVAVLPLLDEQALRHLTLIEIPALLRQQAQPKPEAA